MSHIHCTARFHAPGEDIFDKCDEIMQVMLDLEEKDPTVHDAAISADRGLKEVTIEVKAERATPEEAARAAIDRIEAAVTRVVTIGGPIELVGQHDIELIPA